MRRLTLLTILGLLLVPILMSCSDPIDVNPIGPGTDTLTDTLIDTVTIEIPGDTIYGDTVFIELPGDTVFLPGESDTVYIVINDSIVDTVYVPCDSTFENCKILGNDIHRVSWFRYDLQVVIGSENPHAFGHEIEICITMTREGDHINITFHAWREKIQPSQTLDIWLNGQMHVWPLGSEKSSTLNLII